MQVAQCNASPWELTDAHSPRSNRRSTGSMSETQQEPRIRLRRQNRFPGIWQRPGFSLPFRSPGCVLAICSCKGYESGDLHWPSPSARPNHLCTRRLAILFLIMPGSESPHSPSLPWLFLRRCSVDQGPMSGVADRYTFGKIRLTNLRGLGSH